MNEQAGQADQETIRKTNTKLAVGIGVGGIGLLILLPALFFAILLTRPGGLTALLQLPSITRSAVSDGSRTWLLSQQPDLSRLSAHEKKHPPLRYFMAPLEGASVGQKLEIPAYAAAVGGAGSLVFLSPGEYRTYDGVSWTPVKTDAIGIDPRGALSPDGLYVLSGFPDGLHLSLLKDGTATLLPLPTELRAAEKDSPGRYAQIRWYQGTLCLFWPSAGTLSWTRWNGSQWAVPAVSQNFSGSYAVAADKERLYFFNCQGTGADQVLRYYVLANNDWSGPTFP